MWGKGKTNKGWRLWIANVPMLKMKRCMFQWISLIFGNMFKVEMKEFTYVYMLFNNRMLMIDHNNFKPMSIFLKLKTITRNNWMTQRVGNCWTCSMQSCFGSYQMCHSSNHICGFDLWWGDYIKQSYLDFFPWLLCSRLV